MGLEFRPPSFVQPRNYDAIPASIDQIFETYQRNKILQRQNTLQNAQLAQQGVDVGALQANPLEEYKRLGMAHKEKLDQQSQMQDVEMRLKESEITKNLREKPLAGQAGALSAEEANRLLEMDLFPAGSTVSPAQLGLAKKQFDVKNRQKTPAQNVATQYADKADQANRSISEMIGGGFNPAGVGGALNEVTPNFMKSDNFQASEQAARQFVNAILRRESGAAIPPAELENYKKQYWPQVGDRQKVLEQKSNARLLAIAGLREEGALVPSQIGGQTMRQTRKLKTGESVNVISTDGGKTWQEE